MTRPAGAISVSKPLDGPTVDLPVELWLHILSFLPEPKRYIRNLIGVNRLFFEIALNDIYREVMFIPSDRSGLNLKTLLQLRDISIARRVNCLYIQPTCFPVVSQTKHDYWDFISSLKGVTRKLTYIAQPYDPVMEAVHTAVLHCRNVKELSFHLPNDQLIIPSFGTFVKNMWTSIGPNLRKLTINATWAKLPLLLDPVLSAPVKNLKVLNARIVPPQSTKPWNRRIVLSSFLTFTVSQRGSLQSLTISSFECLNFASFLKGLGHFPQLREFHFLVAMDRYLSFDPSALTRFLVAHQSTLITLSVWPEYNSTQTEVPNAFYKTWIYKAFPSFDFPYLRSLKIGLWLAFQPNDLPLVMPYIPRLSSLFIMDIAAHRVYTDTDTIMTALQQAAVKKGLEIPQLSVNVNGNWLRRATP